MLAFYMDLPILDISCEWNHIICDLMWLASFSEYRVFKVNPCLACVSASFPLRLFNGHTTLCLSSVDRHLGRSHLSAPCFLKCGLWTSNITGSLLEMQNLSIVSRNGKSEYVVSQGPLRFNFEKHCPSQVILSLSCTLKALVYLFFLILMLILVHKWSMTFIWIRRFLMSIKTRGKLTVSLKMSRLATKDICALTWGHY